MIRRPRGPGPRAVAGVWLAIAAVSSAVRPAPAAAGHPLPAITGVGRPVTQRADSFISLWPACACGRTTVLAQFSIADGRRLRTLATVRAGAGSAVAAPHASPGGPVWLTFSSGPRCSGPIAGCGPVPNSCTDSTIRYDPVSRRASTVLTTPPSELVSDAVPSPDGRRLALVAGGCATSYFNQHVVVRDLTSGRQWSIGADATPCHALPGVAWSRDGAQLVFPYGPSVLPRHTRFVPHGTCTAPRFSRLAVVSAAHASSSRGWGLIAADPRCSYQAATFDRTGIAAIEGCVQGAPRGSGPNPTGGWAYVVQLSRRHRIVGRLRLAPGYDGGDIATDWRTGSVLVSELQTTRPPLFDWVWALRDGRLRLVGRYPGRDAPTIIAEPW